MNIAKELQKNRRLGKVAMSHTLLVYKVMNKNHVAGADVGTPTNIKCEGMIEIFKNVDLLSYARLHGLYQKKYSCGSGYSPFPTTCSFQHYYSNKSNFNS